MWALASRIISPTPPVGITHILTLAALCLLAWGYGGGVRITGTGLSTSTKVSFENCSIYENTATSYVGGEGLYIGSGASAVLQNTFFEENSIVVDQAFVTYVSPIPVGTWLPVALCQVYREPCPSVACLTTQDECRGLSGKCASRAQLAHLLLREVAIRARRARPRLDRADRAARPSRANKALVEAGQVARLGDDGRAGVCTARTRLWHTPSEQM